MAAHASPDEAPGQSEEVEAEPEPLTVEEEAAIEAAGTKAADAVTAAAKRAADRAQERRRKREAARVEMQASLAAKVARKAELEEVRETHSRRAEELDSQLKGVEDEKHRVVMQLKQVRAGARRGAARREFEHRRAVRVGRTSPHCGPGAQACAAR